jgi:hypothetical protein
MVAFEDPYSYDPATVAIDTIIDLLFWADFIIIIFFLPALRHDGDYSFKRSLALYKTLVHPSFPVLFTSLIPISLIKATRGHEYYSNQDDYMAFIKASKVILACKLIRMRKQAKLMRELL